MKKIYSIAAALCITLNVAAEGYQVNLQSARQAGMGHVGTGMKLGAEGMHFNPAALTSVKTMEISAGVALLRSEVEFQRSLDTSKTNNDISTPIYFYAGFNVWKNKLFAGISVTNPYGSALIWGSDWAGNKLIQTISMRAFSIQPTLAYKVTDQLSIGAGLMLVTGNFTMDKALMVNGDLGALKNPLLSDHSALASLALSGDAKLGYGYNLGLQYDLTPAFTLGVSYRSKMSVKVEDGTSETVFSNSGDQAVITAIATLNNTILTLPDGPTKDAYTASKNGLMLAQGSIAAVNNRTVAAELPLPYNLTIGASYKVNQKLILAADFQYVGWSAYDTLQISLVELGAAGVTKMVKNYSNSYAIRLGGEYAACEYATFRLGFAFDKTPVDATWYSPETPGADKYIGTAGASIHATECLSFDLGLQYVAGSNNGTHPSSFNGKYTSTAISASIGATYKF